MMKFEVGKNELIGFETEIGYFSRILRISSAVFAMFLRFKFDHSLN